MARPPSPTRCPILNWLDAVKEEAGLSETARAHYLAIGRQAWRESREAGIVHRGCIAAWLEAYRRLRERPADALTAARLLGEAVGSGRALRLLDTLRETGRPGHRASWRRPPLQPVVTSGRAAADREGEDEVV